MNSGSYVIYVLLTQNDNLLKHFEENESYCFKIKLMETFLGPEREKKGFNKGLAAGLVAAVLFISGLIGLFALIPPVEHNSEDVLQGAYFEGSPEFDEYTKQIIITTNTDRLQQSFTGLGSITMHIGGRVYNKGDKALSALQVMVAVIDPESNVIKDKKFVLIPNSESDVLYPGTTISVTVNIGGFSTEDDRANVRWKVTAIKFLN